MKTTLQRVKRIGRELGEVRRELAAGRRSSRLPDAITLCAEVQAQVASLEKLVAAGDFGVTQSFADKFI